MMFREVNVCARRESGATPKPTVAWPESGLADCRRLLAAEARLPGRSCRLRDEITKRGRIQRADDGVPHLEPHRPCLATNDQGTRLLGDVFGDTLHGSNRAFHDPIDFSHSDLVGIARQLITTARASCALHESSTSQWSDQLLEIRHRD